MIQIVRFFEGLAESEQGSMSWHKHMGKKMHSLLDAAEKHLFAGQRKSERVQEKPQAFGERLKSTAGTLQSVFAGIVSLSFLGAFIYAVYFYSSTIKEVDAHPLVVNLNREGLATRVLLGSEPACQGAESSAECWAVDGYDDQSWQQVAVPKVPLHSLHGYNAAIESKRIYYRFPLSVPDRVLASAEELAFTPFFISHRFYEIFVNGRLVQTGESKGSATPAVVVSIPRSDIVGQRVVVGIRASFDRQDKGIQHPNSLYLGPKVILDQAYVFKERALSTYFLLFLLSKGAIFIVFSLFLFFSIDRKALSTFLIYAFSVTAENLLSGNFLANYLDAVPRVSLFYALKLASLVCLLFFVTEFFQAVRARRYVRNWNILMFGAGVLMIVDFAYGSRTVTGMHLYGLTNAVLSVNLFLSVLIGLMAVRMWTRVGIEARKVAMFKVFVAVLSAYFALVVWESYFNQFVGFDKRSVFDLLFFFFIAFATAKEFGFNAGQVVTLESHMAEKRRMELELQEAAEIAKAFLPGEPPKWPFCELGVFHRSLSESSGDWYTFEESGSKRFCHFILCDITGHGVQAALVASTCRTVISALKLDNPECVERSDFVVTYARALNHILYTQGGGNHVSTLLGLTYDQETHELHYVSGGHPNPLLIARGDADARGPSIKPLTSRYSVLGTSPEISHQMSSVKLDLNAEVLAFTDGLPLSSHLKVLKGFVQEGYEMADAAQRVYERIWQEEEARRGKKPDDDVSIVWFRRVA